MKNLDAICIVISKPKTNPDTSESEMRNEKRLINCIKFLE